jgi:small-conductance mechanosensitive channel
MEPFVRLVGPNQAVEFLGVKLVGVNPETGRKLLFSVAFILAAILVTKLVRLLIVRVLRRRASDRALFWTRQTLHLTTAAIVLLGLVSVWFDDPTRLTTAMGLVTAGLAFALQKVVTAIAGYFVILRGRTFNVGDRIVMGGVRGDVIALGFTQTTILEMGQPPPVQNADPPIWVHSRQYTGRVVTVSNAKIFDEPVYNYTREFPYIFEEIRLPISYSADRARAERILLEAAGRHTIDLRELSAEALAEMARRYTTKPAELAPQVYYRLTDNWLELTVRFIALDHGARALKDAISRDVLDKLDEAGIAIASATFELVGIPEVRVRSSDGGARRAG